MDANPADQVPHPNLLGSSFVEDDCRPRIALYYCYIEISDPKKQREFQQTECERLALFGRIRVATEGLNGVLSGSLDNLQEYERNLRKELVQIKPETDWELDVKYCKLRADLPVSVQVFDTLSVKEAKTVVSLVGTTESHNPTKSKSKRRQRKKKGSDDARYTEQLYAKGLETHEPARHLSPQEWDERLQHLEEGSDSNVDKKKVVLLDCRNVYESSVGYFQAPNADTILTNTRKYSELPQVLVEQADALAQANEIYMYCTGGVRCMRASVFLQSLMEDKAEAERPQIYQLHGGIQRYLETNTTPDSLYKGKNFVFDPRRTDPVHNNEIVGKCLICQAPHDDFDNGSAPCENREARCWNCRILVLVCSKCRLDVSCWNEPDSDKPRVYCGGLEGKCHHMPPVKIISGKIEEQEQG